LLLTTNMYMCAHSMHGVSIAESLLYPTSLQVNIYPIALSKKPTQEKR